MKNPSFLLCLFSALLLIGSSCTTTRYVNSAGLMEYRTNQDNPGQSGIHVKEVERKETYSVVVMTPDSPHISPSLVLHVTMDALEKLGRIRNFEYGTVLRPHGDYHVYSSGTVYLGFSDEAVVDPKEHFGPGLDSSNVRMFRMSDIRRELNALY